MNPFINLPTRLVMGNGCVTSHAETMAGLGKKALVVTGSFSSSQNGSLDDVLVALYKNNQKWAIFDRVMSNPTIDCVYDGAEAAKVWGADFIIGVGGGSPMDAAKAIALLTKQDIPREKLFAGDYKPLIAPTVMVPTTAGTGSEVTQYAIITNEAQKTKSSLTAPFMFPTLAYLDSRYLRNVPPAVAINTAVDALSHCVEGYLSCNANKITDALAREGMSAVAHTFDKLKTDTLTVEDRDKLLYASTMGGMVIANTGTTAVHSMGYSLTYFKHIDHGRANGLLLGAFLEFLEKRSPAKVAQALEAMGMPNAAAFSSEMDAMFGKREEITRAEIEMFASIAIKARNIPNCISVPTENDLRELYCKSFGIGGQP
jgi:Alcohol dehydrogenase, class IV